MDPDERYMCMALDLARRSCGKTNPNPMVGAVIVKGGEVVGTGFHKKAGDQHAEIVALSEAGDKARHATLYTNLEPCSHQGRTPPCTEAILHAGIRRVVLSMVDPNPLVSGQGIRKLKEAGIKSKVGVLEEKARRLNEIFIKYITTKMPFVMVKAAIASMARLPPLLVNRVGLAVKNPVNLPITCVRPLMGLWSGSTPSYGMIHCLRCGSAMKGWPIRRASSSTAGAGCL